LRILPINTRVIDGFRTGLAVIGYVFSTGISVDEGVADFSVRTAVCPPRYGSALNGIAEEFNEVLGSLVVYFPLAFRLVICVIQEDVFAVVNPILLRAPGA